MTFKSSLWYPIAILLSVANLVAIGFAAEPLHAGTHGVLAVAFGLWAQRLRQGQIRERQTDASDRLGESYRDQFDALETEMNQLRQELAETQERLEFTERLLAQDREMRRVGPQP